MADDLISNFFLGLILFGAIFSFYLPGQASSEYARKQAPANSFKCKNLLEEIDSFAKKTRDVAMDLSVAVRSCIPLGQSLNEVQIYLRNNNIAFSMRAPAKNEDKSFERVIAVYQTLDKQSWSWIFLKGSSYSDLRIIIGLKNDSVVSVKSYLFYKGYL